MAKYIEPQNLEKHLCRRGPYLTFYNGHCDGFNKKLVEIVNTFAAKYPLIHVFEIDWPKKKKFNLIKNDDLMNMLYLYYKGKKIDEKLCDREEDIKNIFKIVINIYNQNIETKAKNLGSKGYKGKRYYSDNPDARILDLRKRDIYSKRRYLLKERLVYKNEKMSQIQFIKNF